MKKEDYEKLGELEQVIYDHLLAAFNANQYTLTLEECVFGGDGYLNAEVTICGLNLRCAVNKKGYICWFCGDPIRELMNNVPHLVRKICAQTNRILMEKDKEYRKLRIKQLQEELNELTKGVVA